MGLTIHKTLRWDTHIDKITKKANSTLAFLGRNISRFPTSIKAQCYSALVRPTIEYASSVWSPAKKETINKLEAVQHGAARLATGDYQRTSSVTSMRQQLQWQSLHTRRERTQAVMLYQIVYRLVDIPMESYLQPASLRTRDVTLLYLYHTQRLHCTRHPSSSKPSGSGINYQEEQTLDSFKTQLSSAAHQ